jgi:hypothetical protein
MSVHPASENRDCVYVTVIEGTSRVWKYVPDDFYVMRKDDPIEFIQSGLASDSRFKMGQIVTLPYTDEFFKVPKDPAFGENPKIGKLSPRMIEGFLKSLRGWAASPRNPRNVGRVARGKNDPRSVR